MTDKLKQKLLESLYNNALLTIDDAWDIRLFPDKIDRENFEKLKKIKDSIYEFVKGGNNLYIYSTNCGNGKTSWSKKLLNAYFSEIYETSAFKCKGLFINVSKLCQSLKDNIENKSDYIAHIKKNIETCDIVIWDDIGTKELTNFEGEFIYKCINARIENKKANIYTSNLKDEDLAQALDNRLYSRVKNGSINIQLKGKDKRSLKAGGAFDI